MLFLRACKREKMEKRKELEGKRADDALKASWNAQRMRVGDRVDVNGDEDDRRRFEFWHPNMNNITSVIKNGWLQVGSCSKTMRLGVDGTSHELQLMSALSSAATLAQRDWLAAQTAAMRAHGISPAITRTYDATPTRVSFGRAQGIVEQHAKYLHYENGRWLRLSLGDFRAKHPHIAVLKSGLLDMLASSCKARWIAEEPEKGLELFHGLRVLNPPQFFENRSSSCLCSALQSGSLLSNDKVKELASGGCPFVVVSEAPDFSSVNVRFQAASSEEFAFEPNILHHKGKCGAHQCHRMVASTERASVGDVHAVAVAAGHPSHAVAILRGFRHLLRRLKRHFGPPPPVHVKRNEDCVRRTLGRRANFIESDALGDSCLPDPSLQKLLRFFNGDWTSPCIEHWCNGCCSSDEDCRANMEAAAVEVDILCSREKEPSVDDWGSCGVTVGKVSCGMLCHNLLPQSYRIGLPSWASMHAENDVPSASSDDPSRDACDAFRKRIQKKSWRAKLCLEEDVRRNKILALCWCAWPVERLRSELEWLDGAGKGLLDAVGHDAKANPFLKAAKSISSLLRDLPGGDADQLLCATSCCSTLFALSPDHTHAALRDQLLTCCLSLGSQLSWRFQEYRNYPHSWARGLHPGADAQSWQRHVRIICSKNRCCLQKDMRRKAVVHFGGDADRMLACTAFRRAIHAWILSFSFTNISMERLLAMFRRGGLRSPPPIMYRMYDVL